MALIEVKNVFKSFEDLQVLNGINLEINEGEVISIIGSSGSGKSTLLRCLNLLEEPTSGDILYKGTPLLNKDTTVLSYPIFIITERVSSVTLLFSSL